MIVGRMNGQELDKVKTKEELQEILKQYKRVLTSPMIEYINSLIELEFSVLRKYIDDSDRQALAELDIFKKVAIYNIYNRAINISKNIDKKMKISGNNCGMDSLIISSLIDDHYVDLFKYTYHDKLLDKKELKQFKSSYLGNIELFQTLENEEARKAEIKRIKGKQSSLISVQQLDDFLYYKKFGYYNRRDTKKESIYENQLRELEKPLSDADKAEIEITKEFNNLILEDYGIASEDFIEEYFPSEINSEGSYLVGKTSFKKMPDLTIKKHVKYK